MTHFSKYRLRNDDFESDDLLGKAYEFLIKQFADSAGKKGGEFYTPNEVVWLLVSLLKPNSGMKIYDPTVGSGGMLIQSKNYLMEKDDDPQNISLYGQEMNLNTWAIAKMNMFLHGVFNADIRKGDTLGDPKHLSNGELISFDRVIANPPFSLKNWGTEFAKSDPYERYVYGIPPNKYGDLAFIQHMIASLNPEGKMGVVVPLGVLFRGDSEKKIRKGIIEDDLLEGVIGLPENLFYGTPIPAALLIINKNKDPIKKNKVIFINGELEYIKGTKNILKDENIQHIINTYESFKDETRYSKVVDIKFIRKNDYNLNVRRYADTSLPPEKFDTKAILKGGIPISEVEDKFIQETLQGIDLSRIFIKINDEYFDFNSQIESKDQIRNFLDTKDQSIINQFERWWDKYQLSLNKIENMLKKSEDELRDYLKEMEYE